MSAGRAATAHALAEQVSNLEVDDALDAPFVWFGPAQDMADRIRAHQERWGITRYAIREPAIGTVCKVEALLER